MGWKLDDLRLSDLKVLKAANLITDKAPPGTESAPVWGERLTAGALKSMHTLPRIDRPSSAPGVYRQRKEKRFWWQPPDLPRSRVFVEAGEVLIEGVGGVRST